MASVKTMKSKSSNSHHSCCVVGCNNTYKNCFGKKLHLYAFPNRPWEQERRLKWIHACRRKLNDGSPWKPSKNAKICSEHFVNNVKSEDPRTPNYNPTIFPEIYKRKPSSDSALSLFQRDRIRNKSAVNCKSNDDDNQCNADACDPEHIPQILEPLVQKPMMKDVEVQTCTESYSTSPLSAFISGINGKDAFTLVNHPPEMRKAGVQVGSAYDKPHFGGFASIKDNPQAINDLCSISQNVFATLLNILKPSKQTIDELAVEDKLLITIMKLKLGISFTALGVLFGVNSRTISRIFSSIISDLYDLTQELVPWLSRHAIQVTMPEAFKMHFPNCRVIIDCTEMKAEHASTVEQCKGTFSLKYLIGIAPNGAVTFISKGYGGRSSDSLVITECGILSKLEPGDEVLADKGFPGIETLVGDQNAILVMPPMDQTCKIASVQIHVEKVMQRIKIFNILNNRIPTELIPLMDKIVFVCCVITNLQPVIKKQKSV